MRRTQRYCAKTNAIATPTTMLASRPPNASSAVMTTAFSSVGNRSAKACSTALGEGNMYLGTWKTHNTTCQKTSKAVNTATALAAVLSFCFIASAPLAGHTTPARPYFRTREQYAEETCGVVASRPEQCNERDPDSALVRLFG